jgi:hypothetical protein
MSKLVLVHFQPIENYPPAMNMINSLLKNTINPIVFTTSINNNWFNIPNQKIFRLGLITNNSFYRYINYLKFNFGSLLLLFWFRPKSVLFYETYSCFPVYLYKLIFKKVTVFIHHHEYMSNQEKLTSSAYYRFLMKFEEKLFSKAIWLSQTNEDRKLLFLADHPLLNNNSIYVLPNYPPKEWSLIAKNIRSQHTNINNDFIKVVYVGSLCLETMYTKEFANWVIEKNGIVIWDIYCNNYSSEVLAYFKNLNSPFINLLEGKQYYSLPTILTQYHIGIVLYKGHIPNYVYNIPNKVFEYLSCGLEVWYPEVLKSTKNWHQQNMHFALKSFSLTKGFDDLLSLTFEANCIAFNSNDLNLISSIKKSLSENK